jgi:hypothetical protein
MWLVWWTCPPMQSTLRTRWSSLEYPLADKGSCHLGEENWWVSKLPLGLSIPTDWRRSLQRIQAVNQNRIYRMQTCIAAWHIQCFIKRCCPPCYKELWPDWRDCISTFEIIYWKPWMD